MAYANFGFPVEEKQVSIKEVTALRKDGKLDDALKLAEKQLVDSRNEWTCMSLFWVLRDFIEKVYMPANDFENMRNTLSRMEELLPIMKDENGAGLKTYQKLLKLGIPFYQQMKDANNQSKTDPIGAYERIVDYVGCAGEKIEESLHEEYGWILYRYLSEKLKENHTSEEIRRLLSDYMRLKNKRPSLLHSQILNLALRFSKDASDFNFLRFLEMWGVQNLQTEDFAEQKYNGEVYPPFVKRICQRIVESNDTFPTVEFVEKFQFKKTEIVEYLREAYFWKIVGFQKENKFSELWHTIDVYAGNFSSFGPSKFHSEILDRAERLMSDSGSTNQGDSWRFLDFMRKWNGAGNLRKEDWIKVKDQKDNEYPSVAEKAIKKCFKVLKADSNRRTNDVIEWLKTLYLEFEKRNIEDDWSVRDYANLCLWQGNASKAISCYRKLLLSMPEKYYLWQELSDCIEDKDTKIGLLLKAKSQERNEDFIGDIHLDLAALWLEKGFGQNANKELEAYAKHRKEKNWKLTDKYLSLSKQIDDNRVEERNFSKYLNLAEDYVYSEFDWCEFVLTDRWNRDNADYCAFYDGKSSIITIKAKRFPILKSAKLGDVFNIKYYQVDGKTKPLMIKKSEKASWSLLPQRYGVVDYDNKERKKLHILMEDSKLVFYSYKETSLTKETFVKFREYKKKLKDDIVTCLTNLTSCGREEALPHMLNEDVLVDNVNEAKNLFHIIGRNGHNEVVKYDQTNLRPNVGDLLNVTYCNWVGKDKRTRMKIFEIVQSGKKR